MSVVIALIPVALAVAASRAARKRAEAEGHAAVAIQTRMRDDELITQALEALGCEASLVESGVRAARNEFQFAFTRDEHGVLEARFGSEVAAEQAEAFIADLDEEYTRLVQERVYQRVLQQAEQHGMALESEQVEADNSILLTLRVDAG